MMARYASTNTTHSSLLRRSKVPTVTVSQFIPSGMTTPSIHKVTREVM